MYTASKGHVLLTLTVEQFPDLTDAERKLLQAVAAGEIADYRSPNDAENDPQRAETWEASRTIRAQVIRWLCADPEASRQIDPHGILIHAATIDGRLDLAYVTLPVPLTLRRCALKAGVTLVDADTRTLRFSGSVLGASGESPLDAAGAHVRGGVFLNNGFRAEGEVRLLGASIGGTLDCAGGTFHRPEGDALQADRAQMGGNVFLNNGFRAEGEVRLLGASIGGTLDCAGGTFHRPEGDALSADRARVDGSAFLNNGFRAEGTVRLFGASIGGTLTCTGGTFHRPEGNALQADGIQVNHDVFLSEGFRAEGEVRLLGASIGDILNCRGGTFHRPEGDALSADGIRVDGSAFLNNGFRAEGTVRLVGGRVGRLLDDAASWPAPGHLRLDGFVYTTIAVGPTDATARLAWLARQPSIPFRPQPYLQLAKVLRESGHEADAKRVLIAKERARRTYGGLGWVAWGWNWLLDVTIGYGYRPWLALIWAGFWVVVAGVLFGKGYEKDIVIPTKAEAYHSDKTTRQEPAFYPAFNRWLYALDTFVPIINFGQKDYWAPQIACNRSGPIRGGGIRLCVWGIRALYLYRWLHIVAGWVLITLVVTGFTNLVRRE